MDLQIGDIQETALITLAIRVQVLLTTLKAIRSIISICIFLVFLMPQKYSLFLASGLQKNPQLEVSLELWNMHCKRNSRFTGSHLRVTIFGVRPSACFWSHRWHGLYRFFGLRPCFYFTQYYRLKTSHFPKSY